MSVPTPIHLQDKLSVPEEQRASLPSPAKCLRVARVATLGGVDGQNVPKAVQLAMLTEQVLPAEQTRLEIPDPHLPS